MQELADAARAQGATTVMVGHHRSRLSDSGSEFVLIISGYVYDKLVLRATAWPTPDRSAG